MSRIVTQPAAGTDAQAHFRDTVDSLVVLAGHRDLLGNDFQPLLDRFPQGACAMWGVTPGKDSGNARKYARVEAGDTVVFSGSKRFFAMATIAYLWHSPALAERLWGFDNKGQTWEYMYALDDLRRIDMSYSEFNAAAGYQPTNIPQGFNVLTDVQSTAIFRLLPESLQRTPEVSRKEFEEAVRDFPEELDQQVRGMLRVEQGYLRRRLFSTRPTGICALCGCELPVDLLVAAHIKKRSACTHDERLDVDHVVMAACRLGCDELFERGYIAVNPEGFIIASVPSHVVTHALKEAVTRVAGQTCLAFGEPTKGYFAWHFSHTFRGLS
jgi:hypothetical protein